MGGSKNWLVRRTSWGGAEVAWGRFGDGSPVVLCHGTPWSSEVWARQAQALARTHTVYLWDMPGYGKSSMQRDQRVDLAFQGELFAALLREWGLDAPHVVAHDFGGAVALRAHLLSGARYASLCLVDAVALRPWGSPFFRLVREHTDVFAQLPPVIHEGAIRAYISGASHRGLTEHDLQSLVAPWLGEVGQGAFYRQIAQADESYTDDIEARMPEVDVPVHIIWGAEDAWLPAERGRRLHALIPRSTLTMIPGAGHLIQYDAPAALADSIRTWLSAQGA